MKKYYTTFILFLYLSVFLSAQNYSGNWNVISLESNGNTINLPSTVTTPPNINFDNFFASPPPNTSDEYNGSYVNGNGICNSFTSYFERSTNAISLIPYFETSQNTCTTTEETDFENLFFSILQEPGNLSYVFSNDLYNLSFTNSLGDVINLGREDATTNLLSGEWFIYSIWDYDLLLENTIDPNLNIIFLDDINNGLSEFYGSSACNGYSGSYDNPIQTSSFIVRSIGTTLIECNSTEEQVFESTYHQFFNAYNFTDDIFTYEIIGSGSDAILKIRNSFDNVVTYGRQALSIANYKMQSSKLITNLDGSKLQLISETISSDSEYTIYDISGRLIISSQLDDSKNIDTRALNSGVYILNVLSSQNKMESFKFVKS